MLCAVSPSTGAYVSGISIEYTFSIYIYNYYNTNNVYRSNKISILTYLRLLRSLEFITFFYLSRNVLLPVCCLRLRTGCGLWNISLLFHLHIRSRFYYSVASENEYAIVDK